MSESARTDFGHDTTTDEVLEGIDLDGKLALVTGGSGGLGEETARALTEVDDRSEGGHETEEEYEAGWLVISMISYSRFPPFKEIIETNLLII